MRTALPRDGSLRIAGGILPKPPIVACRVARVCALVDGFALAMSNVNEIGLDLETIWEDYKRSWAVEIEGFLHQSKWESG